jgi:D-amino-acid dehydrogenase
MGAFSADVVIIGGGIVGLSSALELQERGKSVVIVDPDDARGRASFGNAGVLSRGSIFPVAGPGVLGKLPRYALGRDIAVRVRLAAFPEFAGWLPGFLRSANEAAWRRAAAALNPLVAAGYDRHIALAERVGARAMIKRNGYMRLYRHADGIAASALERDVLSQHGVRVEHLDENAIYDLEPHLARRFKSGLLFADTGSVESPGDLVEAYRTAFAARGGVVVKGHAEELAEGADTVTVRTGADSVTAAIAVLAAGAWSARFARKLGYRIPLAAERGYHLHLRPRGNAVLNRPVFDVVGGYVMSPMGGTVRVLSGVELARPDDTPDLRQIETVVADACRSMPLDPLPDHSVWMGSRPSTPDGLPVIGFAARHQRLLFAFGHGHIGFANGPITGQIVAQLIGGETPAVPIAAFSPQRFGA